MSRPGYVPCRGACGAREHRIGTAAERNCGRRPTTRSAGAGPAYAASPGSQRSGVDILFETGRAFVRLWRTVRAWWGRTEAPTSLPLAPSPADLHAKRVVYRQRLRRQQPRLRGAELEARADALMDKHLQELNRQRAAWHRWHAPAGTSEPAEVVDPSRRARRPPSSFGRPAD